MREPPGSYLQVLRRQAGLTQRELAELLGYGDERAVSKHEQLDRLPSLIAACGYSVVFGKSLPELFPGLYEAVQQAVEKHVTELQVKLSGRGQHSPTVRKKLDWLSRRRRFLQ